MEILSKREAERLEFSPFRLGSKTQPFYEKIALLEPGEALLILDDEWPIKNMPNASGIPARIKKPERRFAVRRLASKDSFAVLRIG